MVKNFRPMRNTIIRSDKMRELFQTNTSKRKWLTIILQRSCTSRRTQTCRCCLIQHLQIKSLNGSTMKSQNLQEGNRRPLHSSMTLFLHCPRWSKWQFARRFPELLVCNRPFFHKVHTSYLSSRDTPVHMHRWLQKIGSRLLKTDDICRFPQLSLLDWCEKPGLLRDIDHSGTLLLER